MLLWAWNWSNWAHWLVGFFLSQVEKFGRSGDGVYTEYIRSEGAYKLHISSVRTPSELFQLWQKKILPASVLNWTNFKPNRAHWLVGFPILVAFEGIGGVITLGTWGGGVLVSPKFCKFKVLEGIGWCIGIYCGNIYIFGPLFQERMRKKGKIRRK